jgi:hypothetical protein
MPGGKVELNLWERPAARSAKALEREVAAVEKYLS